MSFEDFGKKFVKFSRDTVTEMQKMNEVRQVNSRVGEEKKQIAILYSNIGKKLYDMYRDQPLEGFEKEFQELNEHYSVIEKYTDQIRRIRGVRVCPNCHTEVSVNERFCSSCGEKLPDILHIEEDEDGNTVIEGTASEVLDAEQEARETAEEAEPETDVAAEEAEPETATVAEEAEPETGTVVEEAEAEPEMSDSAEETETKQETNTAAEEKNAEPEENKTSE